MPWAEAKAAIGGSQRYGDSVTWRVTRASYALYGGIEITRLTGGSYMTANGFTFVKDAVTAYKTQLNTAATNYGVPIELILTAMQCSGADVSFTWTPSHTNTLPGYVDEATTPDKITVGLTGILLSEAQIMVPDITVSDLLDVQTNFNACAMAILYRAQATGFDPIYVGAYFNRSAIRDDPSLTNDWRMLGYADDPASPTWITAWAQAFTTALAVYPQLTGITGPSYGDLIFYWLERPPELVFSDFYFNTAATDAIANGLTISSTLSPQLNGVWPLTRALLAAMAPGAMDSYNGFGASSYSFVNAASATVSMTGTELCRLYAALANFVFALITWDSEKQAGFPDAFNPFPATTVTLP